MVELLARSGATVRPVNYANSLVDRIIRTAWSANPHQHAVRIANGELIHSPWLSMGRAPLHDDVANAIGDCVHVLAVKIEAVRITAGYNPSWLSRSKNDLPPPAVRKDTKAGVARGHRKTEPLIKGLGGGDIGAGKYRGGVMLNHRGILSQVESST